MRLFVAVWPPPLVVAALAGLDRPARAGLRWTTEDQWHVTLRFFGELGDVDIERGKESLSGLDGATGVGPVTAVAGPGVRRLGKAVLCVPVAGLDRLAGAVIARTGSIGAPLKDRPFRGHLTLARAGRDVDLRRFGSVPFEASWPVTECTLVASRLDSRGARYSVISRYAVATEVRPSQP